MNICTYEQLEKNPKVRDIIAAGVFYANGKSQDPHFTAMWADVPKEEKERCAVIGLEAIHAIVDDYTTPGCNCDYCTRKKKSNHGRPIMCKKRWDRIPPELQAEIADSCSD